MKTLSSSNKTRLKQYTAVASALVAQGNLNAQVVATNLNPDVVVDSLSGPYALDFNNDANPELAFFVQHISGASSTQGVQFTYEGAVAGAQLSPGLSLLGADVPGSSSSSSFQISALNNGDPISAAANFGTSSNAALGLDLLVDAGILGQIPVQQGSLGANSGLELIALADKVTIVGTPEHVAINVTPDVIGAKVSFVSMSGQEVSSALLTDINNTISFETLSTGIYQVVVSTSTEKTTQRVYVK